MEDLSNNIKSLYLKIKGGDGQELSVREIRGVFNRFTNEEQAEIRSKLQEHYNLGIDVLFNDMNEKMKLVQSVLNKNDDGHTKKAENIKIITENFNKRSQEIKTLLST